MIRVFHREATGFSLQILKNDKISIIHKGLLLKNFLINFSRRFDGQTLPLLVALKLNIFPCETFIKALTRNGFEIEKDPKNDIYFLKEIPMYLTHLEDLNLVTKIIETYHQCYDEHKSFQQYLMKLPVKIFDKRYSRWRG